MEDESLFIPLSDEAPGRVEVKLRKNHFLPGDETAFFGKVVQKSFSIENLLFMMRELLPNIDSGTMVSVLNAYTSSVLKVLSMGNSAPFGELGRFYIAGKGLVQKKGEKPDLTVRFSPSPLLKSSVQNIEITSSEYKKPEGKISSVTDTKSLRTDGVLTSGSLVLLKGSSLKVGGEGAGIWLIPLSERGSVETNEDLWIKIDSPLVFNQPKKLLFALPKNILGGKYRFIVRTRYYINTNYERAYFIEAESDVVEIV